MRNLRIIARLDVKMNWLIKGVQMEGWRKVGDPSEFARFYAQNGADELLFMDVVASLYNRNNLQEIVEKVASEVFVPLTVGGGIRSVNDVSTLLASGADKIAINTAATRDPRLITEIADRFGSQATVISIEAIRGEGGRWHVMTDNGRNHTGREVLEWAREAADRGAGEIILTTIHTEGLGQGFDLEMLNSVAEAVSIPVVGCGGLGSPNHLKDLIRQTKASAVASAQALHWKKLELSDLRTTLETEGCFVRPI